ncbi:MAG: glutamate carboxypeptidase [Cellvibrionaceae bacterium]|jgi:glutamate carboxypeptidase
MTKTDLASQIRNLLESDEENGYLLDLIKRLVQVESPTSQPETQIGVQQIIKDELEALNYKVTIKPGKTSGGILIARPNDMADDAPFQMMVGHTDTVWPIGTLPNMPLKHDGDKLRGPGVFDMKTGDSMMIAAIRCLQKLGLKPAIAPVIILNSDEEIGSPESKSTMAEMAKRANRAFVLEPSKDQDGKIKTMRKGGGRFTIVANGIPSHAGLDPEKGASAITAMANVIQQLVPLNDFARGMTVNPGVISGGSRPNVIAAECTLNVDVRFWTIDDAEELEQAIRAVTPNVAGVTLEITGATGPPLERTPRNRELWHKAEEIGTAMGVSFVEADVGGGSDGNTTSLYCATLDGLGAVGDGAHAHHEFIFPGKLVERTTLLAMLLMEN